MQIPFPLSRLINGVPQPVKEPVTADTSGPVSRGRYLATVGHCINCHTPKDKLGKPLPGMELAGGEEFSPTVVSANLTPDPSGISY